MTKISNRVIWLTNASSGMGKALARQLATKGARLILSARKREELAQTKEDCSGSVDRIKILPLDMEDPFSLIQKAKEAETLFGPVDILVNNADINQQDAIINTPMEVDRRLMELNYFGPITLSKGLLPKMIQRKKGHHVVIGSAVDIINTSYQSAYGASKHALHGFYNALRAEHHKDNIKVTLALPGYVKTNIAYHAIMGDDRRHNKRDEKLPKEISVEKCARIIIKSIEGNKQEVYIGSAKEKTKMYLNRFFPRTAIAIRRVNLK